MKPSGDVRGWAHRWTGRRCLASREAGLKVLTPGAGKKQVKDPGQEDGVLLSFEGNEVLASSMFGKREHVYYRHKP